MHLGWKVQLAVGILVDYDVCIDCHWLLVRRCGGFLKNRKWCWDVYVISFLWVLLLVALESWIFYFGHGEQGTVCSTNMGLATNIK